ncbi:unnamed protein product [Microthlaspi erraticum]|uniref:Translation elongation factor EF1B beta/delta subunit guanine nucleotide exchange domain-containing protein n=1 Tax=Microthlaspi erraticum TaxID=1685480 RepID=A0A6D2IPC1_9BRAS|nr:unnamed protein product [Microthlaspi erraticum]
MADIPNLNSDAGLKKVDEHPPTQCYTTRSISCEGSGVSINGLACTTQEDGRVVVIDNDLIMEEAEEEKKAAEKGPASLKPSTNKKESWESTVIIIMPTDAETDMKKLEKDIRSLQMEGLFWGPSKLVPIGYGLELLRIVATVPHNEEFDNLDILVEEHIWKFGRFKFSIDTAGLKECKSSALLLIKPNDDEADMEKLEEAVRSIHATGLFWGASSLVPLGSGIKLLGIECTAVGHLIRHGRLVHVDDIIKEEIMGHPDVQSCQNIPLDRICNGIKSEEESDSKDDAADDDNGSLKASKKESGTKSGLMLAGLCSSYPDIKKVEEEHVSSIQKEGVVWGASKIINAGYGFNYLRMTFTIVDDQVSFNKFGSEVIPLNRICKCQFSNSSKLQSYFC